MSFHVESIPRVPQGWRKLLCFNWALVILLSAIAGLGVLMLWSVAGGDFDRWARPHLLRFALGLAVMFGVGLVPIRIWRALALPAWIAAVLALVAVELFGTVSMGAQRWLSIGGFRLQPSELAKLAVVMVLSAYYAGIDPRRISRPLWVAIPLVLILVPALLTARQPDLGTALLIVMVGGAVMFVAGVHWAYFATVAAASAGLVAAVLASRGTPWQLLKDYQYARIDIFLDPASDPLGAGYNIMQAKIALGSGGWSGKGFMQGTQTRLNFLPEKHTDFIFTTLAEQFGFVGSVALLGLCLAVVLFCVHSALRNPDRFGTILTLGVAANFFLYVLVNVAMVSGLAPVVGVPLPLVSYGGSVMLVVMAGFGLVQSAHVHRPRQP